MSKTQDAHQQRKVRCAHAPLAASQSFLALPQCLLCQASAISSRQLSDLCMLSAVKQAVGSRALTFSRYSMATTMQQGLACPYRSMRLRKALGGSAHLLGPSNRQSSGK